MNINEFVTKWSKSELKERAGSQEHFLDLCEVFEHPKPAADDPAGERFTFEKGAAKHGGGQGFADVWKRCVEERLLWLGIYNERPTWLDLAPNRRDEAGFT